MQALRDAMGQLKARGTVVFGVSADTAESHKAFAEKYSLNFPLLADPEKRTIAAYGVLSPNGLANRVTFVIGPDGIVRSVDQNVNGQFARGEGGLTSRHGENLVMALSRWRARVGGRVPTFSLAGVDGTTVSLLPPGKKAAVVLFLSTRCPASRAYEERLVALAADPAFKEVQFLGVVSSSDEPAPAVRKHFQARPLGFPVAKDRDGELADHFEASITPTAWVIDGQGVARYRGAIDDSEKPGGVTRSWLRDALTAVLAGEAPSLGETKPAGCRIMRARRR